MFKTKPSLTKPAEQRLHKVVVKRVRAAKAQRARFLSQVKTTLPTEASQCNAIVLVEQVRAAKSAEFLHRYRIGS